jgi:hypothetical protein
MSTTVVIEQMIMIALLIALGFYSYRKSILTHDTTKGISALIVNFTNPCMLVYSMLSTGERLSGELILLGMLAVVVTDILLIVFAEIIPRLLKVEEPERYCYWMLCVFGNVGFIGIPLTNAVLGPDALVYVAFHNLFFSLLIYTVGINKILTAAGEEDGHFSMAMLKSCINTGTVSIVIGLVLYLTGLSLPAFLMSTIDYVGRSTTFLSMMILGCAVARMSVKKAVTDVRLLVYSLIRLICIPAVILVILKLFIKDDLIINTTALMLAVPAGNMPLIMATRYGLEAETISDGIVVTTLLSIITIPIVTLFV